MFSTVSRHFHENPRIYRIESYEEAKNRGCRVCTQNSASTFNYQFIIGHVFATILWITL